MLYFLENLFASQQVLCTIKQLQMRDEAKIKKGEEGGIQIGQKEKRLTFPANFFFFKGLCWFALHNYIQLRLPPHKQKAPS